MRVLSIDFRAGEMLRAGSETACLYDPSCLAVDVLAAVRFARASGSTRASAVGGSLGAGGVAQAAVEAEPGEIEGVVLIAGMSIQNPERMQGRKLFVVTRLDPGPGGRPRLADVRAQFDRAPAPKELLVLEGEAHAQFIFGTEQGERLMGEILRFLAR
jgi:pimeloyl-ACP methyl ester carboxylesterase